MWAHENWSVRTSQAYCASRFFWGGHRTCWRNSIFTPSPKNVLFKTRDLQFAHYPWDSSAKLIQPKWKRLKMRRRHFLGVNFWIIPGDSKCPFHPLVGGHLTPWKGHLTIPKRSLWITRSQFFCLFDWNQGERLVTWDDAPQVVKKPPALPRPRKEPPWFLGGRWNPGEISWWRKWSYPT